MSAAGTEPPRAPRPMLARLARELPRGDWQYEPKWDGFRCVAVVVADAGAVDLLSRHGRTLGRYFPEVRSALAEVAARRGRVVLDGELVIERAGQADFPALLARTHPSASRVARLARETPATFVVFDLLAAGEQDLAGAPLVRRRALLEALLAAPPGGVRLTPATRDPAVARGWMAASGHGVDGVVAKALDQPYLPGQRGWVKVKPQRTADCVVAGLRTLPGGAGVASLLLGLWDGAVLRHVGVTSAFGAAQRRALLDELRPFATRLAGHPWEHGFGLEASPVGRLGGSAGRWDPGEMSLDWAPLAPERVCEVAYDQLDGARFRHPAQFVRWRPDREPASCGIDQLERSPPPRG